MIESAAGGLLPEESGLIENLDAGAVRSGAVALGSQAVKFSTRLGLVMIMARLVSPQDFGAYAMVDGLYYFLAEFKDLGLCAATIQRETIDQRQISFLFWVNVAFGLLLACVAAALAPALAWFYHDPRLTRVALALASTYVLAGLTAQHQALLQRRMRFLAIETIAVTCLLFSGAVMIALAWKGAGYWAYAWGAVAYAFLNAALVWLACEWRPSAPSLSAGAREMFTFGGEVTGARLLDFLHRNVDNALVGRTCGAAVLGDYVRAYSLLLQPLLQIFGPVSSVMVPSLSRLQGDRARFREYVLTGMTAAAFLSMPMAAFTCVDTRAIILILAGPQWVGAVPIFRALAPAVFMSAPLQIPSWVLLASGRSRRLLEVSAATCVAVCAAFVLGLRWGASGVAAAYSAALCLSGWPLLTYALSSSPVTAGDVAKAMGRPALAALAAGAGLVAARPLLPATDGLLFTMLLQGGLYLGAYLGCWLLMPGGPCILARSVALLRSVFAGGAR